MEPETAESANEMCSMKDVNQRVDKKRRSEARRLESFVRRRQLEKQHQAIISRALNEVDSIATSKKTVFKSDSEDECTAEVSNEKKSHGVPLFDDEGVGSDEDIELSISNRHFGSKGAKLMLVEAKFDNDERFRLSEKFIEDDDRDEENSEEMEINRERKATLAILSKVLGKSVRTTKSSESGMQCKRAAPFPRFDPDDEHHLRWLNERKQYNGPQGSSEGEGKEGEEEDSQKMGKENEEKEKVEESRVIEGYYFEVDRSFAESLKKKLKVEDCSTEPRNGFSFLRSVGRDQSVEDDISEEESMRLSKKQLLCSKEVDVRGMDTGYVSKEGLSEEKLMKLAGGLSTTPHSGCFFFVTHTDHHITKVVDNFRRKYSVEAVSERWSSIRMSIVKVYKGQRKQALKRQKEMQTQVLRQQYPSLQENGAANEKPQSGTCGFDEGDEKSSPLKEATRLEKKTSGRSKRKKRHMEDEVNAAIA